MRNVNDLTELAARLQRTLRFAGVAAVSIMLFGGILMFLISASSADMVIEGFLLNLLSEFIGAALVALLLQGVMQTAFVGMMEELEELRDAEDVMVEAEERISEAEERAAVAEARADAAEATLAKMRALFLRPDIVAGLGRSAVSMITSLLSSSSDDDTGEYPPQQE